MTTTATFDTSLRTVLATLTGGEALIFADANAPQPPKPFWTLRVGTESTYGSPEMTAPNNTGLATITETKTTTVTLQRFADVRGSSMEKMQDLKLSLRKPSVRDALAAFYLVVWDTGTVQNVTALLAGTNQQMEDRAALDLFVGYKASVTDNVGLIDTVSLTSNMDTDLSESGAYPKAINIS
jgi:hypothetical protein